MPSQYMETIVITVPLEAGLLLSLRDVATSSIEHSEALGGFCKVTCRPLGFPDDNFRAAFSLRRVTETAPPLKASGKSVCSSSLGKHFIQ